jgi:hypothetical protein
LAWFSDSSFAWFELAFASSPYVKRYVRFRTWEIREIAWPISDYRLEQIKGWQNIASLRQSLPPWSVFTQLPLLLHVIKHEGNTSFWPSSVAKWRIHLAALLELRHQRHKIGSASVEWSQE